MFTIEMVDTRQPVDISLTSKRVRVRESVGKRALHGYVHTAERIHDLDESVEASPCIIVYADPKIVLDGSFDQARATTGVTIALPATVGSVDLVKAMGGNPGIEVTRDGQKRDRG
jgi:hypothetical protein